MLRKLLFIGLISVIVCSCTKNKQVQPYIDSKLFFEEQATLLNVQHTGIEKAVVFGDKEEKLKLKRPDWEEELKPFTEIDLRTPSFAGRYLVDTVFVSDNLYEIIYQSTDPKLDLQKIIFGCAQHHIQYVRAQYVETNTLYNAEKNILYDVKKGYTIKGKQKVKMANSIAYSIEAIFVRP